MKPLIWKKAFFILIAAIGILWLASHWYVGGKTPPVIIINAPYPARVGEAGAPFTSVEAPLGFTGEDQPKPVSPSAPYSYVGAPGYGTKPYMVKDTAPYCEAYTPPTYTLKDMIPIYRARQLSMSPYFEPYTTPLK